MKIKRFEKLAAPVLSIIIALLIGTAIIKICGYHPLSAYSALLKGAFGSFRYTMATLEKSVPLILCGIAAMVAMKSGIFNIGAEGQLFMGAIGYAVAALYLDFLPGSLHLIVCILVSILFGGAWAFVPAIMKIRIGANEVVTSIMLNYIAQLFTSYLVSGPLRADGTAIGEIVAGSKITYGFPLAIVLCVVFAVLFKRTQLGYEITAAGMNARAAEAGGIQPDRVRIIAMMVSGALAGLAGGLLVASTFGRLVETVSTSFGFDGISIAVLGLYTSVGVFLSSLLFGALHTGSLYMEMFMKIPSELIDVLQGVIIVVIASPAIFQILFKRGGKR